MRLSEALCKHANSRLLEGRTWSQAELRRATSDCYYAMYHCVCEALVEPHAELEVEDSDARSGFLKKLYRTPSHAQLSKNAQTCAGQFSSGLTDFANHFISMRHKRENADYDPHSSFQMIAVKSDIHITTLSVEAFWQVNASERIAFSYALTLQLKDRN